MALIDVYNIDTLTSGDNTLDWLKPLVGVFSGFFLGLLPGWYSRTKDIKRTGELFKSELSDIRSSIIKQNNFLNDYLESRSSSKSKNEGLIGLSLCLVNHFDLINSLDRLKLIKHFEKRGEEKVVSLVGETFQILSILDKEMTRLEEAYETHQIMTNNFVNDYLEGYNLLKRQITKHRDTIGIPKAEKDRIMQNLRELFFENKSQSIGASQIINFREAIHEKLGTEVFADINHPLYEAISNFDLKGQIEIGKYIAKNEEYNSHLRMAANTLEAAYKFLHERYKLE